MESTPITIISGFVAGFSVMLGLVVWIVRKLLDVTIPEQNRLFREQMEKERELCSEGFAKLFASVEEGQTVIRENQAIHLQLTREGQAKIEDWVNTFDARVEVAMRKAMKP